MTTAFAVSPEASSIKASRPTHQPVERVASHVSYHPIPAVRKPLPDLVGPIRQDVSDEMLLQEISSGGEWAMEVLYTRYARYAYALAYHITHDGSASEDVVQDVFLAIWRKAASYQEQHGCVRSWLQAIVHHRAIDWVRAVAHHERQYTSLEDATELSCNCTTPSAPLEKKLEVWEEVWNEERSALLRSILMQLPPEQRQVIALGYFGGYTHAEIAERWHIPLGTVKGRMRLGLQKMKYLLAQHGIDSV